MTEQTVTLRIVGENGQLVASVRASKAEIAGLGQASGKAGQQAQAGARGVDAIGSAAERTQRKASLLSGTLGQIKGLLAGYVGLQGIRELGRAADTYSDIVGKLKQVTSGEQELAAAKAQTFAISQQYYTSLDATVTLYSRAARGLKDYENGAALAGQMTATLSAALLAGRASTAEAESAMLQFSQALSAGRLGGEEFNAVNESAPMIMDALAKSLGVPREALKKLAEEGKITRDVMVSALTGMASKEILDAAAEAPLTIGRAWQTAKNELLRYVGEADQASGTSSRIAQAIKGIGENIDKVVGALVTMGKVAVTVYTVQMLQSGRAWIANLILQRQAIAANAAAQATWGATTAASFGAAMKSMGALGIAFNVLGSAVVGWQIGSYLRDEFLQVRLAGVALVNGLMKGWEYVKQAALIAWEAIKAGYLGAINNMRNGLADLVGFHAKLANLIPDFMGGGAVAAGLQTLEGKLRSSESAADGFKASVARINAEAAANRQQIDQITGEMADYEIAQEAAKKATQGGTAAAVAQDVALGNLANKAGKTSDELKRLAEAQREFERETARRRAELEGPQAVADFVLDDELASNRAARASGISADAVRAREQVIRDEYAKTNEELRRRQDILGQVHAEMEEEIRLSGLSAEARRVEETVIRAINAAKEAGQPLNAQEIADLRAYVTAADATIEAREEQRRQMEDLAGAVIGAAQDGARAWGDFVASGFRKWKDFVSSVKDMAKRLVSDLAAMWADSTFVTPIKNWFSQWLNGGSSGFQGGFPGQGNGIGQMFSGAMNSLLGFLGKLFGRGGAAQAAIETGTSTGFKLAQSLGVAVPGAQQAGGVLLPNGMLYNGSLGSGGAGFGGISPWMGALGGAAMGWGLGGDTAGKFGGALAGGAAGYGLLAGAGAMSSAMAGGAGLAGGLSAGLAAVPVVGWVALAALAINAISGGKLFGTKYKTESASQTFGISDDGAFGSQSVTEVKQRSFFRGRKWRTTTTGLDAEAMAAVNELFETITKTVATAAGALGVEVPEIVGGTFKREFDSKGNLKREFGTIAGRVYNEAQDAFAERLLGENLLAVAKQAGSAAELEQLANAYRGTGKELQEFATLALAVQSDLRNANGIWHTADGDGLMTRIVGFVESLAQAGESLADAYARIQQTILQYGDLIGGVRQQIATHGLNQYQKAQLDVELQYRAMVKQANELAKSLGLSGARAEDLMAIEQLRALQMADLAQQFASQSAAMAAAQQQANQWWLQDLDLSDLSPLRDDQKLAKSMDLLQQAVSGGDYDRAHKLAEQALGFGRDLYASGEDYNALYAQVTALVGDLQPQTMEELQGLTNEELGNLASLVDGLPSRIAQELAELLITPPAAPGVDVPLPPAPVPNPLPPPPSTGGGGGGGGGYDTPQCVAFDMFMDDGSRAVDARAGDLHNTLDPERGHAVLPIRVAGRPVTQPCVRLVTNGGAALVCSTSTPFTDPAAPADLPEFTTLAPDMLGKRVFVQRGEVVWTETVVDVAYAGEREVIPLDFGGCSFPAGESADALVYSHNMMKSSTYDSAGMVYGVMAPEMARALTSIDTGITELVETAKSNNARLERLEMAELNGGSRVQWNKSGGVMY